MLEIKYKHISYDENMIERDKTALLHNSAYELLYSMLNEYFGINNPKILKTAKGKPYIDNNGVYFSISHTYGLVACAVSDSPVGIDCEKITTKYDKKVESFANRYFLENEINLLKNEEFSSLCFYKIWTAKEAIYKMQGGDRPITKIDVTAHTVNYIFEKDYIICVKN